MKLTFRLSLLTVVLLAACGQEAQSPSPTATEPTDATNASVTSDRTPLDKLLTALGGVDALRGLSTVSIESTGQRFELDEHMMPGDVDDIPVGFTMNGYYDSIDDKLRIDLTRNRDIGEQQASLIMVGELGVITGQDAQFGPPGAVAPMTSDRLAAVRKEQRLLNPHIAFRELLTNGSVTEAGDEALGGVDHHVLVIDGPIAPIRLYVNATTGNITKLATMETEHLRRDVAIEVMFSDWTPADGGIAFPNNVTMTLDGETVHEENRTSVAANTPIRPSLFEFPAGVTPTHDEGLANWGLSGHQIHQIMASIGFPRSGQDLNVETEEIAPGVHHIRGGSHHSLVIEQENGLVVAEAPMHELRSEAVIGWIESTFPDKPITHVIATHHHTDHSAGLRAYVARGATVVVHDAARSFFADIFNRPSTLRPDALARNPRTATIETMPAAGNYSIADSERTVEVYPLANDHAGDMVFIYVAGAGIVFQSDIYNPNPMAPAGPGGQAVQAAIEAAGVDVSTIAGGHGGTIDYETFESLLGG